MQSGQVPLTLALNFRLTGSGWAAGDIRAGVESTPFTASYLSDALGNLVAAAADLQEGAAAARFSFDEEPGEYRWLLEREGDSLIVQILAFDELWGHKPDQAGRLLFRAQVKPLDFCLAVKQVADQLLELHGLDGYFDRWVEAPFPVDSYTRLCKALWMERHPACGAKVRKRSRRQANMRDAE